MCDICDSELFVFSWSGLLFAVASVSVDISSLPSESAALELDLSILRCQSHALCSIVSRCSCISFLSSAISLLSKLLVSSSLFSSCRLLQSKSLIDVANVSTIFVSWFWLVSKLSRRWLRCFLSSFINSRSFVILSSLA